MHASTRALVATTVLVAACSVIGLPTVPPSLLAATAETSTPTSSSASPGQGGVGGEYYYSLDPQRGTYQFGYDTGSLQHQSFREETRNEDGGVSGSYGYVDAGVLRVTEYTADQLGYRCRQTVRYLVEPSRGVFVPAPETRQPPALSGDWNGWTSPESGRGVPAALPAAPPAATRHQRSEAAGRGRTDAKQRGAKQPRQQGWQGDWNAPRHAQRASQRAQPARVLGKKVAGHYRDFTDEPAVGGTAAVTAWDSAHNADLRDDEVFGIEQSAMRRTVGGTMVWPVSEDGVRMVWQPF